MNVFSPGRLRGLRYLRARILHFKEPTALGKNIGLLISEPRLVSPGGGHSALSSSWSTFVSKTPDPRNQESNPRNQESRRGATEGKIASIVVGSSQLARLLVLITGVCCAFPTGLCMCHKVVLSPGFLVRASDFFLSFLKGPERSHRALRSSGPREL